MLKKAIPILFLSIVIAGVSVLSGYMWKKSEEGTKDPVIADDEDGQDKEPEAGQLNPDIDSTLILSEFVTTGDDDADRNTNLSVACSKINGTVMASGAEISFNELIGPCTKEEGYVEAKVLINGTDTANDVGGGVCQVATTIYNAALRGNLVIVESHRHSAPVTYVPVGMDAAIQDPYMDLKVKNPYEVPVMLITSAEGSVVTAKFVGMTLKDNITVDVESYVTEELPVGGTVVQYTDQLPEGEERQIQEGHPGYKTESYKVIYDKDGIETGRELITSDVYPAVSPVIEVGRSDYNK